MADNDDTEDPFKYGILNPVNNPSPTTYLPGADTDGPQGMLRRAQSTVRKDHYQGEISVDGEYNGVVLTKETISVEDPDPLSPYKFMLDWMSDKGAGKTSGKLEKYFVRVPELHAMNPVPEDSDDEKAIRLHHAFVDVRGDGDALASGDIVKVSFYNSEGVWMPQIIEKVGSHQGIYSTSDSTSAKSGISPGSAQTSGFDKNFEPKDLSPSVASIKYGGGAEKIEGKTKVELIPPSEYQPHTENRVRMPVFGQLRASNKHAIPLHPAYNNWFPEHLHILAAKRFNMMKKTAKEEHGFIFQVQSGLRETKWGYDFDKYKYHTVTNGEYDSLSEARSKKAFLSPHQTGLGMDLLTQDPSGDGVGPANRGTAGDDPNAWGLTPDFDVGVENMRKTDEFQWLKDNAHRFGLTPYEREPWHWEVQVPIKNWRSGEEFITENESFAHRVREMAVEPDGTTNPSITTSTRRPSAPQSNLKERYPILKYLKRDGPDIS